MTMTFVVVIMRLVVIVPLAMLQHKLRGPGSPRCPRCIEMPMDAGVRMAVLMPTVTMSERAQYVSRLPATIPSDRYA